MGENLDRPHSGCCGCMSIRSAARIVAILALILSILSLNLIGIGFSIMLLVGVLSERPQRCPVLAFLIWMIIYLVALVVVIIIGISYLNDYSGDSWGVIYVCYGAVLLVIFAWISYIILIYYRNMDIAQRQVVYVVPSQPSFGQPVVVQYSPAAYQPQPQPYYYGNPGQPQPQPYYFGNQGQPQQAFSPPMQAQQYVPQPYATCPPYQQPAINDPSAYPKT